MKETEKMPDPYWFVFSDQIEDWMIDKDRLRFRKVWRDKQDRKKLREGKFARV